MCHRFPGNLTSFRDEFTCRFQNPRTAVFGLCRDDSGLFGRSRRSLRLNSCLFRYSLGKEEELTLGALLLRGAVKRKPRLLAEFSPCPESVTSGSLFKRSSASSSRKNKVFDHLGGSFSPRLHEWTILLAVLECLTRTRFQLETAKRKQVTACENRHGFAKADLFPSHNSRRKLGKKEKWNPPRDFPLE